MTAVGADCVEIRRGNGMSNRIKELRKKAGLTQVQLSDYLEVDKSMIAKIEKEERNLTTVQLSKLADLFACSEDYILGYDDSGNPLELDFHIEDPDAEILRVVSSVNRVAANLNMLHRIIEQEM